MLTPSPQMQPYLLYKPPPTPPLSQQQSDGFNLNNKVSPSMLLIIIILAIIFFVSGLLHLLVRYLVRPSTREPDDVESVTALQGQLQQLFHLHDAGVDQYFIDTLPVFNYKAIIGLKDPFDCAVCLCEFEHEDKLRLLPMCSHAFHMGCIDTWLLSHSTCPLCRASLLSDYSPQNACPPVVLALESGSEDSREIVTDREANVVDRNSSNLSTNSRLGLRRKSDIGSSRIKKPCETGVKDGAFSVGVVADSAEKVVTVKLGKFKNVDGGDGSSSNNGNVDARRCFSMGSFEYVMDENSSLRVPIRTPMKKQSIKKPSLPLIPGYRAAMSEYDCESRREFDGFEAIKSFDNQGNVKMNSAIGESNKDSFSVSKIWIRGKDKPNSDIDSSRRAFSFRFPLNRNAFPDKEKNNKDGARRTKSEIGISRWENGGDEESQSRNIMDAQASAPSFARRTLLWLVGKQSQNKVVHSSSPPNV